VNATFASGQRRWQLFPLAAAAGYEEKADPVADATEPAVVSRPTNDALRRTDSEDEFHSELVDAPCRKDGGNRNNRLIIDWSDIQAIAAHSERASR
jgi:hypothetical protein